MSYSFFLPKIFLILLYCCCCSFSAVPAVPSPAKEAPPVKTKRQQKKRLRLQKRLSKRLEQPKKNHATFNILGFSIIVSSPILLVLGFFIAANNIGLAGLSTFAALAAILALVGVVFCIIGLIGHKKAERPKIGFAIAGLIIVGIPTLIMLFAFILALFR